MWWYVLVEYLVTNSWSDITGGQASHKYSNTKSYNQTGPFYWEKIYGMRDIWLQILLYADRNRSWPRMPKQFAMLGNGGCVLQNSNIALRIWLTLNNGLILHAFFLILHSIAIYKKISHFLNITILFWLLLYSCIRYETHAPEQDIDSFEYFYLISSILSCLTFLNVLLFSRMRFPISSDWHKSVGNKLVVLNTM